MNVSRNSQSRQLPLEEGTLKKLQRRTKSFEKKHPLEGRDVARHDPGWQKLQQRRVHSMAQRAAKKGSAHVGQPPREGYSRPGLQPYSDEDPGTRHTTVVTKGPAWDPSRQSHSADNVAPMSGKREATYKAGTGEPMGRRRGNRKKFFQTTDTGEYANIAESPTFVSRTAQALSLFVESVNTYESLVEWSRQPKKIRAPNLARAVGWRKREDERAAHNRMANDPYETLVTHYRSAKDENDPEPDHDAVLDAKMRENPGMSPAVADYHKQKDRGRLNKQRMDAIARKRAKREKRAAEVAAKEREREARLRAMGLSGEPSTWRNR